MKNRREKVIESISQYRDKSVGENHWGNHAEKHVSEMVESFHNDLIRIANNMEDCFNNRILLHYFANIAMLISATTRDFEPLKDDEIEAYNCLMDDIKALCADCLKNGFGSKKFFTIFYVREIIKLNALYREDVDCVYRCSMITPNHRDMYEIVHCIVTNADKLLEFKEFEDSLNSYMNDWTKSTEKSDGAQHIKKMLEKYI